MENCTETMGGGIPYAVDMAIASRKSVFTMMDAEMFLITHVYQPIVGNLEKSSCSARFMNSF